MAVRSSDRVRGQIHRLFNFGTIAATTDEQLLVWFTTRRDDTAEAAFEELVLRHGPMVFRVCRSVLHDTSDSEDAFQAVFLILAHRAKSIRRSGSVASWLFGVAHRVASRAKGDAARRRARELRVARERTASYVPADDYSDEATLHDEINRLPERLRAAVTLCYLEGLTYDAAAQQLGISAGTIRGRLARARECLRRRLTARGITVPASLIVSGTARQTRAAIPASLAHSTIRIALGFMAGSAAGELARGVLNAMLFKQLKVMMVLLVFGIGGHYYVWNAFGGSQQQQVNAGQAVANKPVAAAEASPMAPVIPPVASYRLSGTVRIEQTGQPIAGATLRIYAGDFLSLERRIEQLVVSGVDGRFSTKLPAGPFTIRRAELPVGYCWVVSEPTKAQSSTIGPDEPVIERDYQVRKGTIWNFQFSRGPERKPGSGSVSGQSSFVPEEIEAQADDTGMMHLTLPADEREVALQVQESSSSSAELDTGFFYVHLKWDSNFRPDDVKRFVPWTHMPRGLQLIDANENSAYLASPSQQIEPVIEKGRLVIHVALPNRGAQDYGAVTGQVLDDKDRPIAGVRVGLAAKGGWVSNELRHQATTNAEGRYRLRDIPRTAIDGKSFYFQIVAVKEGCAGHVSRPLALKEGTTEKLQAVDPIRLNPGLAVSGIVVDHRGLPVAGARVQSTKPVRYGGLSNRTQTAWTDENGRFTLNDLRRGMTMLFANAGPGGTVGVFEHLMVGSSQPVILRLPEPQRRKR